MPARMYRSEGSEVSLVIPDGSRALVFGLPGEAEAPDKGLEGWFRRCLDGADSRFSFWERPASAGTDGLTTKFHACGRGGRI